MSNIMEIEMAGHMVRARLMSETNPRVVELVRSQLPVTSFALHPSVSGAGFILPTMITYTGKGHMVPRHPGAVYLYAPGQSMVFTYGQTNESAPVNKFAEVFSEDMPKLVAIGKIVYERTLANAQHSVITAKIRLQGDTDADAESTSTTLSKTPIPAPGNDETLQFEGGWKNAEALFWAEARRVLEAEPEEIYSTYVAGVVPSGMGTGGNILPVWMHQWSHLQGNGVNTLYRFIADTEIPNMTLEIMVHLTRNHLFNPFNHFEFLADLGLTKFKLWATIYSDSLDDLTALEDYKILTTALLTLVNLYYRRVQLRFPFYLGKAFPPVNSGRAMRPTSIPDPCAAPVNSSELQEIRS